MKQQQQQHVLIQYSTADQHCHLMDRRLNKTKYIQTLYHGNTPITITLLVDCWRSHFIFPITPGIPFFQKHNQMTWVRLQFYWNNVWKNARAILYLEVTGFRQHGQCQVRESDVFDAHAACNGFHVSSNCTDKTLPMSQRHFNKYI